MRKVTMTKLRNLVAKDLRTPKYKMRVEVSKVKYKRKTKHKVVIQYEK
jgi:ATP sulfurylase